MAKQHTTHYVDTFIAVAADCPASEGTPPRVTATRSVALRTFELLRDEPYVHISDDVVFGVYADRNSIAKRDRPKARRAFFSKGQACLRASALGKRYGWGIHFDSQGRIALHGAETAEYRELAKGRAPDGRAVTVKQAMRSARR